MQTFYWNGCSSVIPWKHVHANNEGRYPRSRTRAVSLHKSPGSKGTTLDLCRYERRNRRTIIVFVINLCYDNLFERTIVPNWPCPRVAHADRFRWSNNVQVNKITLPICSVQRFICPHTLRLLLRFYTRQEILGLYVRLTIRAERDKITRQISCPRILFLAKSDLPSKTKFVEQNRS